MPVDALMTQPHYGAHWQHVWEQLPDKGVWCTSPAELPARSDLILVASFGDLRAARPHGPCVYAEHGAGMSYSNNHPSYAGASDRKGVVLFLSPNRFAADRNSHTHPGIPQTIVGCPRLDSMWGRRRKPRGKRPLVVFSWHWNCMIAPESRWAWPWYKNTVGQWSDWAGRDGWQVAGHAHPKARTVINSVYRRWGIPIIDDFDEVLKRADLYVSDVSSTLWEFAATRRPVLTLNAPWYRRRVNHGLRFWEAIPGLQCWRPESLREAVAMALEDPAPVRAVREKAVAEVYPVHDGTGRAVEAITEAVGELQWV